MLPRKPVAPVKPDSKKAQSDYKKLPVDKLVELCRSRLPGFAFNLFGYPRSAMVMLQWRYDLAGPLWEWQRTRPEEAHMGGTFPDMRTAFASLLGRADRFDLWTWEQKERERVDREAQVRAASAAAAPVQRPEEPDEGEELVPAADLPKVEPVPPLDPYLKGILEGGKPQ